MAFADGVAINKKTSVAPKDSELLEEGEDSAIYRCPGVAGYDVIFQQGHGRSWVNLVYDSEETNLMDSLFEACPGVWPNVSGSELIWRGEKIEGGFVPFAVIVRMKSVPDEADPETTTETFVVVQAAGAGSRVVGHVPGKKGLAAAEKLADELCWMR